jgi:putative FmdB family regulatory protein
MPIYEYQCTKCNDRTEVIQKFSDPPYAICDKCGGDVRKLMSAPAIQFKGSGFYKNDYASAASKAETKAGSEAKSDSGGDSKPSESKGETKTESKSETKSEAKTETKTEAKAPAKTESKSSD